MLGELFDSAEANLQLEDTGQDLSRPLLLDLRMVNLLRFDTSEIKHLIRQRISLGPNLTNNPCAYVAGDDGSFGMLRMLATYAEVFNLREDGRAIVTEDMEEAVQWLFQWLDSPQSDYASLLRIVRKRLAG